MSYNLLKSTMFVLGHIGIGSELVSQAFRGIPSPSSLFRVMSVGCLAPDLIDKPLYYFWGFAGIPKPEWIAGSRTIGHTLVLWLFLSLFFLLTKKRDTRILLLSFLLGVLSHLILDNSLDLVFHDGGLNELFWPILGEAFTSYSFKNATDHLITRGFSIEVISSEIIGGYFLWKRFRRDAAVD